MSEVKPIAIVGHGDEMILSAKGVIASGGKTLMFLVEEEQITPFSLIRGSWLEENLRLKFFCPDGEDTTDTFQSLFSQARGFWDVYVIAPTYKNALASAVMMMEKKQLSGVIFCGDLPQVCLNPSHDFSVSPVWQTVSNCEMTPDAHLQENEDFSSFPWSHCWTVAGNIVKIYPGVRPPISSAEQRLLPVSSTCTCLGDSAATKNFAQIGPSANWNPSHHRRDIFQEAKTFADKILNSPGLF